MESRLVSTSSSKVRTSALSAARAAAEAFAAALLAWAVCPVERRAVAAGLGAAWLASSVSTTWLMIGKARSPEGFWWAFGGGMALRLLTLVALAVWSNLHPIFSQPALLVSYAFGVLGSLLLEYRHIKLK